MQTSEQFDVVFYNQTIKSEEETFSLLQIQPTFDYIFYSIERENFFGSYPLWDLYAFHKYLLDNNLLSDYFMSLHMEEFLDSSYTENILHVLTQHGFSILLGNLYTTSLQYEDTEVLLGTKDSSTYDLALEQTCLRRIRKWSLGNKNWYLTRRPYANLRKSMLLGFSKILHPTRAGFTYIKDYKLEDVYAMSREFAKKTNWFHSDNPIYFEDIHINWRLTSVVRKHTKFPVYFNSSKIYHINHGKYYYQIENEEFANGILNMSTDNPVLIALQQAINLYRSSDLSAAEALRYSRQAGTVKHNVKFHVENEKIQGAN